MRLSSVQEIIRALDSAKVRFLVVGGLAVNAHGYRRFTADVDIVIQLVPANVRAAFEALASLGYRPRVPITVEQFANSELRERLIREKGMQVLQFWSDAHRETAVDVFVTEPFAFDEEFEKATVKPLAGAGSVKVVSIPTLIAMKEVAGRAEDRVDIQYLRLLLEES